MAKLDVEEKSHVPLCSSKGSWVCIKQARHRKQQLNLVSDKYTKDFESWYAPFGTSSGLLTAILCFSSVVKPAFCVVSATLSVVGTAILGIHFPVSSWMLYAIAFAESIGEPPPIDTSTSHPDLDIKAVASLMSWIGLLHVSFS